MNPNPNFAATVFDIYVPAPTANLGIAEGSAIVASVAQRGADQIQVYYEGNLYNVPEFRHLATRCLHAAGRASARYPTIARATVPASELVAVGQYDLTRQAITAISDRPALQAWVGDETLP